MPIYTGSDITADRAVSCDVCIVGSGAGGAVLAERLTARGKHVVILEDGGFHTSEKFSLEERSALPKLYQDQGGRATADSSMMIAQGRAVGGTTVVNWTTCFRTPERVMEHWAEHHGFEGPSHATLVPHWERLEQRLNVTKMRLEQVNKNNMKTWQGLESLGWHKDLLSRNIRGCAHTGFCGMGCPLDAKQSMLVTMIPDAVRGGADVYANAWVEHVVSNGRRATGVVARIRSPETDRVTSHTLTVEARVVVLSGGAINTPAILLRSEINPTGRTGHRTFLHPAIAAVGVHEERIDPFVGSPQYVYSDQFVDRSGKMGFLLEGAPGFPMLMGGFASPLGAERQAQMELLPQTSVSAALLHDGFDLENDDEGGVVTLTANHQPKIDYAFSPRLKEGLAAATDAVMRVQLAGGARQAWSTHPRYARSVGEIARVLRDAPYEPCTLGIFVAHVMGGCAMGKDSANSVVDSRSLRHHAYDNLFVVDGSVYPTSLTVNPQMSIYALASWASDHVHEAIA